MTATPPNADLPITHADPLIDAVLGPLTQSERELLVTRLLDAEAILTATAAELTSRGPARWGGGGVTASSVGERQFKIWASIGGCEHGAYIVESVLELTRGDSGGRRAPADARPDVWFVECELQADPPDSAPSDGMEQVHVIPETRHATPADAVRGFVAMAERLREVLRSRPATWAAWCRQP